MVPLEDNEFFATTGIKKLGKLMQLFMVVGRNQVENSDAFTE